MADSQKLKIFVSWSDEPSRTVATLIRTWLPNLSDLFDPFMSDEDIDAGTRGLAVIADALVNTSYGLAVVTPQNQHAPWLIFETGALAREVGPDPRARVTPLLFGFGESESLQPGPLIQFQYRKFERDKVRDVVKSMARLAGADEENVAQRFEWSWPDFSREIDAALAANNRTSTSQPVKDDEAGSVNATVLAEILENTRELVRRSDYPTTPSFRQLLTASELRASNESPSQRRRHINNSIRRMLADQFDIKPVTVKILDYPNNERARIIINCESLPGEAVQRQIQDQFGKNFGLDVILLSQQQDADDNSEPADRLDENDD